MTKPNQRTRKPSPVAMLLLSTLALTAILTGCQGTKVVAISADRQAVPLPAGKPYTPAVNGWFVPDARMIEILDALDKARIQGR